jgi:hypothetical protein
LNILIIYAFRILSEHEWDILNLLSKQDIVTINILSDSIKKCTINKVDSILVMQKSIISLWEYNLIPIHQKIKNIKYLI